MAIPFYENEEQLQQQQHQVYPEIDQVDGPMIHPTNQNINSPPVDNTTQPINQVTNTTEEDLMAWKILALAMCKALKDHYQQNMNNNTTSSTPAATSSSTTNSESSTAVIQILPNGQVQPKWN